MSTAESRSPDWMLPAAVCAAGLPSLLAFNVAPSPTFLNQALALVCWGLLALGGGLTLRLSAPERLHAWRAMRIPAAVFGGVAAAAAGSWLFGILPSTLALSALGTLAAAAVLAAAGAQAGASNSPAARRLFEAFCLAWVFAGLLNSAVGAVQVFAPGWADGTWIAHSAIAGRAVGNLRQPNHLCTLLLWAVVAAVGLHASGRLRTPLLGVVLAVTTLGLVLTASRTAVLGVALLVGWGLVDKGLPRRSRQALLALPLLYGACWAGMWAWAELSQSTFGGQQRLAEADLSASRFGIWSDTLALIREHPWAGVGFGEFNFAWSLSELPKRPPAFFDHTHNLLLQWAVEMGLPIAAALTGLLGAALWIIGRAAFVGTGSRAVELRVVLLLLAVTAVHSQLEYPLWYAYFLLPTAWVLGHGLGGAVGRSGPADEHAAPPTACATSSNSAVDSDSSAPAAAAAPSAVTRSSPRLAAAALAVALGGVWAVSDYAKVADVFDAGSAVPLNERIARGQRSWLFGHHADYAAATVAARPETELRALSRASHYLLDTRLMMAWADAWAGAGDPARARHIAERLREFRNPASAAYFAVCQSGAAHAAHGATVGVAGPAEPLPYPCDRSPIQPPLHWQDFGPRAVPAAAALPR